MKKWVKYNLSVEGGVNMKIRIELDTTVKENEFIIRCNELTEEVTKIQKIVSDLIAEKEQMIFYKRD